MQSNLKAPEQARRRVVTVLVALSLCVALVASLLVAGSLAGQAQSLPRLQVADATAVEATSSLAFKVTLDSASADAVTVDYAAVESTGANKATAGDSCADVGADFFAVSGTLTFAAGQTSQTVHVEPCFDGADEPTETFVLRLDNPSGASLAGREATGTILDSDEAPLVGFDENEVGVAEADGGIDFVVSLDAASGRTVTVRYAAIDGSATAPDDYSAPAAGAALTFDPGVTERTISLEVHDDDVDEADLESFTLVLSSPSHTALREGGSRAAGTIHDDDEPPTLSISAGSASEDATERNPADGVAFSVNLDAVSGRDVTVSYQDRPDTAYVDIDYVSTFGTLTIPAGRTSGTIIVPVLNDAIAEGDETFRMLLENSAGADIDPDGSSAVGTINDDRDEQTDLWIHNVDYNEIHDVVDFKVELLADVTETVTVNYRTVDGTAKAATTGTSGDYMPVSGTLAFDSTNTVNFVSVPLVNDNLGEGYETFGLQLSNPSNASAPADAATALIIDDEAVPCVTVDTLSVSEDVGNVEFTVMPIIPSGRPLTVSYATSDGTAVAGDDYVATSGTIRFAPGEAARKVRVPVIDDPNDEADETFTLELAAPSGTTLCDESAAAQIADNDDPPTLNVSDSIARENAGVVDFAVSLEPPSSRLVIVSYETSDGTAVAGEDYTARVGALTFQPGEHSKTVEVALTEDFDDEADETFTLTLSSPQNADLGDGAGEATITEGSLPTPRRPARLSSDDPPPGSGGATPPGGGGVAPSIILNSAPRIGALFDDVSLQVGGPAAELDLATAVTGPINVYKVLAADPSVVTAVVLGSRLVLNPVAPGATTVSLRTANGRGAVYLWFVVIVS